jgi:rubrerythrin
LRSGESIMANMGLLTGYLLYKAGKQRGERKARERDDWVCDHCGYTYSEHLPDEMRSCPE